jgi:glutathione S-transferase
MPSPKVKLYMFPGSNSVYTGRLMLEHKEIDYSVMTLMPGPHAFIMLGLGFKTMGVPAVKIDGRRVQGTRAISRALDEEFPHKPLFPADPAQRKLVEDAERWGEELQNATRRVFYCIARRDHEAFTTLMSPGRALAMRGALRVSRGFIIRLATGAHRATDEAVMDDLAVLPERLDQIDAWLEQGVLGGEQLNAADFQIAVNVAAMLMTEDLAPFVAGRPMEAYARRIAPDYDRTFKAVLPPEWLAPLREDAAAQARTAGNADRREAAISAG